MPDSFQRLLTLSGPEALSLNAQAALGPVRNPERSQTAHLIRHFLERFFNHETASPDGDAKGRLITLAFAAGLPGFVVSIYLWPVYHHVIVFRQDHPLVDTPVSYWAQVNHHFFFVMYSFVAMGLVTLFERDLFFPDLLDVFVLTTLPIAPRRVFLARVIAISILLGGFLFDANFLAPIVLPMATDPPQLAAFLSGHLASVALAGLFASGFVLALQGILLALLGEKLMRRISLLLQGILVAAFLVLLLLFPLLSGVTPTLIRAGHLLTRCFPPFWFLGLYQQGLASPIALPIWAELAHTGEVACVVIWLIAMGSYPLAHRRRVRALIEGTASRAQRNWMLVPWHSLLHCTFLRSPRTRGVFHFIGQTTLRVPRYRIYLVLYGGVGASLFIATILRFTVQQDRVRVVLSPDGMRIAIGIVAFWVVAGLRSAFASPGNQQGGWIFRAVGGKPPAYDCAVDQCEGASTWALLTSLAVTLGTIGLLQFVAPLELRTASSVLAQLVVGGGFCLLLTDAFFLQTTTPPFTGAQAVQPESLALTALRYFTFFPFVTWLALVAESWLESGGARLGVALAAIVVAHLWLRHRRRSLLRLYCNQFGPEEGEDEFPMQLGLRY